MAHNDRVLVERIKGRWVRFKHSLPRAKGPEEMAFWKKKKALEGDLGNAHYKFLYTEHWGLDDEFYRGKKILGIGCGPRGSLEWADMAVERIGLDALVDKHRALGIDKHKMSYVNPGSKTHVGPMAIST